MLINKRLRSSTTQQISSKNPSTASSHNKISPHHHHTTTTTPWHHALKAFRHQLFAGQELTSDLAERVTKIFERQGDAADLLRWWILFRCENVPPTVSEARALLYHNMWKQALYTSSVVASTEQLDAPLFTEFVKHAAVATCRSGNWRLALQLCQNWEQQQQQLVDDDEEEDELLSSRKTTSSSAYFEAIGRTTGNYRQSNTQKEEEDVEGNNSSRRISSSAIEEVESRSRSSSREVLGKRISNDSSPSWAVALSAMFAKAEEKTKEKKR